MSDKSHKQSQKPLKRETLQRMIELELQQLAVRLHEEHGVDVAVALHMLYGDSTGTFLAGFSHDSLEHGIYNFLWLAVNCVGVVRDLGVPIETIVQLMARFAVVGVAGHPEGPGQLVLSTNPSPQQEQPVSEIHTCAEILPPGPKASWLPVNRPIFPNTLFDPGQPVSDENPERSVHPFRGSSDVLLAVLGNCQIGQGSNLRPLFQRSRGFPKDASSFTSICYAASREVRQLIGGQGWLNASEVETVTVYYSGLVRRDLWPEPWLDLTIPQIHRLAELMGDLDRVRLVFWFTEPKGGAA